MGAVEMGTGGSYKFEGSTITQTAYCIYCDKCGSFRIGKYITFKAIVWITCIAVISLICSLDALKGTQFIVWLYCMLPQVFILSAFGAIQFNYFCRKCGNKNIGIENILGFTGNDRSVLDVPYESTRKLYMDDY